MFDITTLAATDTSTLELVGGDDAPLFDEKGMEVGPTDPGAMGAVPISWATIGEWQHCMGLDLPPWLVRLLRRLSVEFVAETVRAREPDCPPPWTATSVLNRDEVSRKVTNAFRALMMSKEPST